ncbi:MAG TPA: isoleucine--tRNA ligase [Mycobacteriales bacterium]|nr:isoleucine--tRNA ligase [Mycobacteriales bacterium]
MSHPKSPFMAVSPRVDLPEIDHRVIEFWKTEKIFERSLAQSADGPRWVFYEGPPTANGMPGVHHVEARAFKDVFPRFKTMKGFSVPRRAGWDCHGLPVELAVEKELGISGKPDIERVGVAEFNARCRESVQRHVDAWEELTERVGYWTDLSAPYVTMSAEYIQSVWWALAKIHRDGLLSQDYRVAPYCPRCGTTLSDHELAQGYHDVVDPSVYVRMPAIGKVAGYDDVELLIWTTTPWTLVSNTAIAVNPDVTYAIARTGAGTFVVAEPLLASVLGEDTQVLTTLPGTDLAGVHYRRPFDYVEIPNAHWVVLADYVTTSDGTGLVHQAPAFGADDLLVGRENGLPVVNPVAPNGHFLDDVPVVGGIFFKDADPMLVEELGKSGRLFREQGYEHPYPHCWRCDTPLMYYAQLSWYIRTTKVRDALLAENEKTTWYPAHIKHGRYGDWLENNIDWALSRTRYWGTPLPLWRCENGHVTAVESLAQLGSLAGRDLSELDPHRPFIDEITFDCPQCSKEACRVPEVIDAWFDSGSMPFAQLGYPHRPGSKMEFAENYPAQYICEALDQTRGWFYTLMAIGTLAFEQSSYENVLCLGLLLAEDGVKMSKHLGNILPPLPLMEKHGADALRWFMLCSGSPWSPRRIGDGPLEEIARKVLLTYWNTASFFSLYASLADWSPESAEAPADRPVLDRWALAQAHQVAEVVDDRMENFDPTGAGRALAEFIDDLSNWYVRRSRQRFWAGDANALVTLHECLNVLTRLLAPFVPFITEEVWRSVVAMADPEAPDSVHLTAWPVPDPARIDTELLEQMRLARVLAEAGRAARKNSGVRVRQPLGRALVGLPHGSVLPDELLEEVAGELNVRSLQPLGAAGEVVDLTVKPNFRSLGRRFGKRTQQVANAITAADAGQLAAALRENGHATVELDGEMLSLEAEDVTIGEVPRSGWVVETTHDVTIALDTEITPELRRAGLAREIIRFVQDARKQTGLEVADRIALDWHTDDPAVNAAWSEHAAEISTAVLAVDSATPTDPVEYADPDLSLRIRLAKVSV